MDETRHGHEAASPQYTETGALTDEARRALVAKAVADLVAIQKAQRTKASAPVVRLDLDKKFEELKRKRERYEQRRLKKAFGLKRHRQKRIVGKRGHRETRLWEQGTLLKHAYEAFQGLEKRKDEEQ